MQISNRPILFIGLALAARIVSAAEEHTHEEEMTIIGPHGGLLLQSGSLEVELQIYEEGVAPEWRAWAYADDEKLSEEDWSLSLSLQRLGGHVDRFSFAPAGEGNFLRGDGVVAEPHSFDVTVNVSHNGQVHSFSYESHQGRIKMDSEMARRMGIGVATAGSEALHQTVRLYGNILPDPTQIAHVHGRYPGIIESIDLTLGDRVEQGETLAIIQANDSLQNYEVFAPITGTVVDIHANPGELSSADSLLTIANYERVWAALNIFPGQHQSVRQGQQVTIRAGQNHTRSSISYLNPGEGRTPYVEARVPIDNSEQIWTPGLLVDGDVTIGRFTADLAVESRSLQSYRNWQVVFIRVGDIYEIRPLLLGRTDGQFTEVLSGLNPGDVYVVDNSFLLKADLEKSGATHSH